MPYFHVSAGLRGCYLPDSSYIIRATTRRELKEALASEALASEAERYREAGYIGATIRSRPGCAHSDTRMAQCQNPARLSAVRNPCGAATRQHKLLRGGICQQRDATRSDYRAFAAESD